MAQRKSLDALTERLSEAQRNALVDVQQAHATEAVRLARAKNSKREAVRVALEAGVPARVLMAALGVGRARIYQMKDEAEAFSPESFK